MTCYRYSKNDDMEPLEPSSTWNYRPGPMFESSGIPYSPTLEDRIEILEQRISQLEGQVLPKPGIGRCPNCRRILSSGDIVTVDDGIYRCKLCEESS